MEIIINGKQAFLKENTSFEFISENSMFTGSDSYTLTISFPLKDCPQNIAIFGHIHRADVEKKKVVFDCDIRDRTFFKSGSITITEINEVEVKTQFLEGRSEQNFADTFDEIFLNELSLGYPENLHPVNVPLPNAWRKYPDNDFVPLPWVNNTSGNIQNEVTYSSGVYSWTNPTRDLTFQPYLLYILKKICEDIGYTGDFSAIEQTDFKYLLICNTLPYTWGAHNFAIALPHWSLTEFFEQLELFLYGEFTINHKAKHIAFRFSTEMIQHTADVLINKVVNEYTAEISREESSDYLGVKNLAYAENDNRYWAYRSCEWYIKAHKNEAVRYEHLSDLLQFAETLKESGYYSWQTAGGGTQEYFCRGYETGSDGHKLFYAADVDTYFIMFCYRSELIDTTTFGDRTYHWYKYYNRLEPVNQFGKREVDPEGDDIEIKIVPAWIDDTDDEHGPCLFLQPGEMGSNESWTNETDSNGNSSGGYPGGGGSFGPVHAPARQGAFNGTDNNSSAFIDEGEYDDGALAQGNAGKAIEKGEVEEADAYFDCIYMAFWKEDFIWQGMQPFPIIDKVMTNNNFEYATANLSLRLNFPSPQIDRTAMYHIDGKKKYTFSFLADEIPDPRALFHINGGKYLCEKITAHFTEKGMSKMLKGVFYRLEE